MPHRMKLLFMLPAFAAAPAFAAEPAPQALGPVRGPDGPLDWSAGLEAGPEFRAASRGSNAAGDYADTAIKASLGYTFLEDWTLNGSFQANLNQNSTQQYYGEGGLAYKFKLGDFSLSPQAALGVTWDATGLGDDGEAAATYYALYLAGDLKLSQQWSWNVFNLRWRDAFDYQWQTPKVATGLTYSFSDAARLNVNLGYSWKNTGDGYFGDKINVALAMKYGF